MLPNRVGLLVLDSTITTVVFIDCDIQHISRTCLLDCHLNICIVNATSENCHCEDETGCQAPCCFQVVLVHSILLCYNLTCSAWHYTWDFVQIDDIQIEHLHFWIRRTSSNLLSLSVSSIPDIYPRGRQLQCKCAVLSAVSWVAYKYCM